ncbi:MAG TPA: ABC transporter permease [Hyphomicrobiaceae bacterium]|nr:ABC transporter permease [Hyphomicrobiaceae bacterium]
MSTTDSALDIVDAPAPAKGRNYVVTLGRIALALLLLAGWKIGADRAGPLYVADPILVAQRIIEDTGSGALLRHIYVTLRLASIGFAIGCFIGVALPFALRRLPRLTNAVEPYVMASVGVPKYALVPLFILWFGIDDAPKLWLVGLLVFYPVFIAVFAGIRNVDRRLMNMARVLGASEVAISREVVWNSLLPFFIASLKISLPRAISATIIGEFLVGDEGLGFLIENSRQNFDTTGVFAGVVVSTALVLVINALLVQIDRRLNAWRPVERDMAM